MLEAWPCTLKQANELVGAIHRHHKPVTGHRFSIACYKDGVLVGVAIVGRPVARKVDQDNVAEVTRLASDGTSNVCSFLYSRCARAADAMGFMMIQTYTLESEPGTSLRAAGWTEDGVTVPSGVGWNNRHGRTREQPTCPKTRWRKYFKTNGDNRIISKTILDDAEKDCDGTSENMRQVKMLL